MAQAFTNTLRSNTSAPGGQDLFANIVQEAIFVAQEQSLLVPLTTVYDITNSAGKTIQVPVYPTVAAADLSEGEDITTAASVAPTAVEITAAEYGVMSVVTDLMKESASRDVAADIGRMLGEAIAKKQDETVAAIFDGFSTTLGSGATLDTELTADIVFQGAARLREENAPGPYYLVATPRAMYNLKKQITNSGGTNIGDLSDVGNAAFRTGLVGELAGVQLIESNALTVDNGNTVGALFAPQAIGIALKKNLEIEVQRDASLRADEIVATATWGVAELVDQYGVKLTLDSGL